MKDLFLKQKAGISQRDVGYLRYAQILSYFVGVVRIFGLPVRQLTNTFLRIIYQS